MAKTRKEHMVLVYKKVDKRLYGFIRFYKQEYSGQKTTSTAYRESKPFVIGRYLPDDELEVFGSVVFLLQELRRLVQDFIGINNKWHDGTMASKDRDRARADALYHRRAMDYVILVSTHARNLLDIFNRLNKRTIPSLGHGNVPDGGRLEFNQLFDVLIHNRYYYFDGGHVRDLFSDKQTPTNRFMGYGFDIADFFHGISEMAEDITVKDLTNLLRLKMRNISANSKPHEIISLVQNVEAFSSVLKKKIPHKAYDFMRDLMFSDITEQVDGGTIPVSLAMHAPNVKISPALEKKELEITVKRAIRRSGEQIDVGDLEQHKVSVGYEDFLRRVDKAFGNDRLISGPRRMIVGVEAK